MKQLKYIGYYANQQTHPKRSAALSATNKMDYICESIHAAGYDVEIISASDSSVYEPAEMIQLNSHTSVKLFQTFGSGWIIKRVLSQWLFQIKYFFYLLTNLKPGEPVLVYHAPGYINFIVILKWFKKFKLILEVEEIYSSIIEKKSLRDAEYRLFHAADAYLFPTELLNEKLNSENRPYVIIHGTYRAEAAREGIRFESDPLRQKKHLLYAGTFNPHKGGAIIAAAAAEFLTSDYHIHILGFGTEQEKKMLQCVIEKVSGTGGAVLSMDGLLSGEAYIRFLQSCDAGFSTQNPYAAFNDTSFPSKVLSYMANGLRVISVRIPVLETSAINNLLYYYDGSDPKAVADAVLSIDWDAPYDSRTQIQELDKKFRRELRELFERL